MARPFPRGLDANGKNGGVYADRIRELALSLPKTYEDRPWGFPVFKVGDNKLSPG
jgi:hypothetical protein